MTPLEKQIEMTSKIDKRSTKTTNKIGRETFLWSGIRRSRIL